MPYVHHVLTIQQIGGSSLFLPWLSDWVIELALQENAIIVSPDYRLLPESTGSDILDDMDDFWKWLSAGGVENALQSGGHGDVTTDLTNTLVLGESAGELTYLAHIVQELIDTCQGDIWRCISA